MVRLTSATRNWSAKTRTPPRSTSAVPSYRNRNSDSWLGSSHRNVTDSGLQIAPSSQTSTATVQPRWTSTRESCPSSMYRSAAGPMSEAARVATWSATAARCTNTGSGCHVPRVAVEGRNTVTCTSRSIVGLSGADCVLAAVDRGHLRPEGPTVSSIGGADAGGGAATPIGSSSVSRSGSGRGSSGDKYDSGTAGRGGRLRGNGTGVSAASSATTRLDSACVVHVR